MRMIESEKEDVERGKEEQQTLDAFISKLSSEVKRE